LSHYKHIVFQYRIVQRRSQGFYYGLWGEVSSTGSGSFAAENFSNMTIQICIEFDAFDSCSQAY